MVRPISLRNLNAKLISTRYGYGNEEEHLSLGSAGLSSKCERKKVLKIDERRHILTKSIYYS
jgi:hypothetical protein